MDISLAHEQSQKTLKQRNLFVILSIVLGILVVVMFGAASTRDREVVLQPILSSEMVVSSSGVSSEYLEAVTRDAAHLALNRSPDSLEYWMDSIIKIAAPEARGPLKEKLMRIVDEQQGSQVTQFITLNWIRTDPETLVSEVGAELHTVVGSREVRRETKNFRFEWKYTGVSLKLLGFGVVVPEGEGDQ